VSDLTRATRRKIPEDGILHSINVVMEDGVPNVQLRPDTVRERRKSLLLDRISTSDQTVCHSVPEL
jgi:hypothetical protein